MQNFNGATVIRVVNRNGNRIAGIIRRLGLPDVRYDTEGLMQLSVHLRRSGQRLKNAVITSDGRIVPYDGKKVKTIFDNSNINNCEKTSIHKAQQAAEEKRSSVVYTLKKFGLLPSKTNSRLTSIIVDGVALINAAGVKCELKNISETSEAGKNKNAPYLTAFATIDGLSPRYKSMVSFGAFFDGSVDAKSTLEINPEDTSVSYYFEEDDTVVCTSAVDIRNAVYLFLHRNGKSTGYNASRREIDMLVKETEISRQYRGCRERVAITLPHIPIDKDFRKHIVSFVQIEEELRKRFLGTYAFSWETQEREATLSVYKYITAGSDELSDKLLDIRLELCGRTCDPYNDYDRHIQYVVNVSHKTVPTAVTRGGGRWVSLQENRGIRWLDELGYKIEALLNVVFSSGVLRESVDVIACGRSSDSTPCYLVKGRDSFLSADDLLKEVKAGKIVNNVRFRVTHYGELEVDTGSVELDRYGNKMPKLATGKKGDYIIISFCFVDVHNDGEVTVSTGVKLDLYRKLASTKRSVSVSLDYPNTYLGNMLDAPKSQLRALQHLGTALNNEAIGRGYTSDAARAFFLTQFMRCCRFTGLADIISGNRTPVETLVERMGCCVEKSVLGAALALHMGLTPSIITRYSPDTRSKFHSVLGVRLPEQQQVSSKQTSEDFCKKSDGVYTYVQLDDYLGLELSENMKQYIGAVGTWGASCTAATTSEHWSNRDQSKRGQVVVVPITEDLLVGTPLAQAVKDNKNFTISLTDAHWKTVQGWWNGTDSK